MNKKLYDVVIEGSEVTAISLVDEPAIEENFIYLNKEKEKLIQLEINEKHMLYGAVLRPDFPIYRIDYSTGEEYYIRFPKETIEKLSQKFMRNGFQRNITLDHETDSNNIYVVESWIKSSMDNDKSISLGLDKDLPIGTWFVGCKVEDDIVWESIKRGERNGFSIESFCNLNEINFKSNSMTDKKENMEAIEINDGFWDKLRQIVADAMGKPQESPEVEETVGKITDEMEVSADTNKTEVIEQVEETSPQIEETVNSIVEDVNEISSTNDEAIKNLEEIIKKLNEEIEAKNAEIETLKKENENLSKQPSVEPINVEASKVNENNPSFLDFAKGKYRPYIK